MNDLAKSYSENHLDLPVLDVPPKYLRWIIENVIVRATLSLKTPLVKSQFNPPK